MQSDLKIAAEVESLSHKLLKLHNAISNSRSRKWKLRVWSRFIRARDDFRCVMCAQHGELSSTTSKVVAHHIFRRCVLPSAEFDTGNGISLCPRCHGYIHRTFNGKPLPSEPLNKRGGDDQDLIASLYHALEKDGTTRGIFRDEFYFINDKVMATFKTMQGFDERELSGSRVFQAHDIWERPSVSWYEALGNQLIGALLLRDQE